MTQAFNLSQLANKVNTSGQLDVATGSTGTLPVANGGTNNGSLAVTAGGALYTDGSKVVNVGAGTSGQLLQSNGASAPSWISISTGGRNMQVFGSSGSFTVPSGITKAVVTVVGGGGAGNKAGGLGSIRYDGAGGGFAKSYITTLVPSDVISITVGTGGSTSGASGGTSSFGSYLSATGGGGASTTANSASPGVGTVSIGTALRQGTGAVNEGIYDTGTGLGGNIVSTFGNSGTPTWTANSRNMPGTAGYGEAMSTVYNRDGTGGVVLIEW
jgi:hypothetical protein